MKITLTPIDEALDKIISFSKLDIISIPLSKAIGKKISESVYSNENIPSFDKAAMDGYACRFEDIGKEMICVETVFAGKNPEKTLQRGECAKIMTGAKIPEGADGVFMYEDAEILSNGNIRCLNLNSKKNICYLAEDVAIGQSVIEKNIVLKAHHIAILAMLGITDVNVYKNLSIGIIATGTELVEPNQKIEGAQIRNSNSSTLMSLIPEAKYFGIAQDDTNSVLSKLRKAFDDVDIVLITGGASDSDFDMVPKVMDILGFKVEIRKVAMQPGKPFLFAQKDGNKFCFGLSGNPVSSYIQFIQFVQPFINQHISPVFPARLLSDFKRKRAERVLFVPGKITPEGVELVAYNGSAHIAAFAIANAIVKIEAGITELKKGENVYVRQI